MAALFLMILLGFGVIAATISAFILGKTVSLLTKDYYHSRFLIQAAWGLPFATLAWLVVVLIGAMAVNESRDRDPGIGDDYWCRLPNGYQMATIDVLHHARLKSANASLPEIHYVQQLQLKDPYMFGSTDSGFGFSAEKVDSYFQLDLRSGT